MQSATCAERDGAQRDEEACGGRAVRDEGGVDSNKRRRTREDVHGGDGDRSAATSGCRSAVDCGVGPAGATTTGTLRSMIGYNAAIPKGPAFSFLNYYGAMELLGSMAHDADLVFGQAHGGATRVRDKSNPDRFGNGHSAEAKRISLECKKLRWVVRFVHQQQLNKASQLCLMLAADGVELPDVYADEPAVLSGPRQS